MLLIESVGLYYYLMTKNGKIIIPSNASPWPHEIRVAKVLSKAGYTVEFIASSNTAKTPDIWLNGIPYEIKSPKTNKTNSLEHILKRAVAQSSNIIIDTSRIKNGNEPTIIRFLKGQARSRKGIKNLLIITKKEHIIDMDNGME